MIAVRIAAVLLMFAMLMPCLAEPVWSAEEVHGAVNMMFLAAAGTTAEDGQALRENVSEEEILALNEEMTLYRSMTLPWILAAFGHAPEIEPEEAVEFEDNSDDDEFGDMLGLDDFDSMEAPDVLDMDDDYIVDFDDIDSLDSSIDSIDDDYSDQ